MTNKVPFIVTSLGRNADPFMLHIYAAQAEQERTLISRRKTLIQHSTCGGMVELPAVGYALPHIIPRSVMMARSQQSDTASESGGKTRGLFRERISEELIEFAVFTVYLYICFAAVICFKAAVLQAQGIAHDHLGLAIIKAALCAKFMLVGRAGPIGERFRTLPLIVPTLHKSFVFLLPLVVLTLIEEIVVGEIHGETVTRSISGIAGGTLHQFVATILIIFLILTPYFALRSLGRIVGDKILVRLFFDRRHVG